MKIYEKLYLKFEIILNKFRLLKLKLFGAKIGKNVKIHGKFFIQYCDNFEIGDNSHINYGVFLGCRDKIIIGKNVHISSHVIMHTGGLNLKDRKNHLCKPIIIKDNVWITTGVIINPGVTIGENSIILPGSVVVKDIPSNVMAGGIPAKIIKKIDERDNK
jgi:galactoside O-acetyltransferase